MGRLEGLGHSLFEWQFNSSHPYRLDWMFDFIDKYLDGETCVDSGLPVLVQGRSYSCATIQAGGACSNPLAASHCPFTCGACDEYGCEDSMAPLTGGFTCDQAVNYDPDFIATKCAESDDLATTCRKVCDFCNN